MFKSKKFFPRAISAVAIVSFGLSFAGAAVSPDMVEAVLSPGESMKVAKHVTTPEIPTVLDVCLLEDETGSFGDDIGNLQGGTTASDLYDTIVAAAPGANFAVAGFRDYPVFPHGSAGDWVYRLHSAMSPVKASWLAGIGALSAGGGLDIPESQYDAIVAAAGPGPTDYPDSFGPQGDCGWRDPLAAPGVQRVLVVTTDAAFHLPGAGKPHVNTASTTEIALNARNIILVGLKAPGAGLELDVLAGVTGGSVQALSSSGANIASAILAGLSALTTDVWHSVSCDAGLNVSLTPVVHSGVPGGSTVDFDETITVDPSAPEGTSLHCEVTFYANHHPEAGAVIGVEKIWIEIPDKTAPRAACIETVNPHGKNIPPAGSTTLPGPKGGQNEDGFYELQAKDNVDPAPSVWVKDVGSGTVFGPFVNGDKIKYTEANGAMPNMKKIGSANGQAGAIATHITGTGDAAVYATDASGNKTEPPATCLVPPPLK